MIEPQATQAMTDYYVLSAILIILSLALGWLFGNKFSGAAKLKTENESLTTAIQKDAKRIITLNDQIAKEQGSVAAEKKGNKALEEELVLRKTKLDELQDILVDMNEKFTAQDAELARVEQINEQLRADVIAEQGKVTEANDEALPRLIAAEDAYLDLKLIDLKGFGTGTVKLARKHGITMRKIAIMPKDALNELLDKAMVPKVARKYDLQKQAKRIIADMEKVTRA